MAVSNAALERAGDGLFVAFACHFAEAAWQAANAPGATSQTVLLQPHGDELLTSTEKALKHCRDLGQPLPILIAPTDRLDDTPQAFEYAGVLEAVVQPEANFVADERKNGLFGVKGKDWMLPTVDDWSYATFGVVVSSFSRLWPTSIPVLACQNIIAPNEGSPCEAVARPAPKRFVAGTPAYNLFQAVRARLASNQ